MKIRNILIIIALVAGLGNVVHAQTATLTFDFTNESTLRSLGGEIEIVVTGDTINSAVGTVRADADEFLEGLKTGSSAWNSIIDGLDEGNIELSDADSVATVTIPSGLTYYITENDSIVFTIPKESLKSGVLDIEVSDTIAVTNEATDVVDGSDMETSAAESDFWAGDLDYTLTLSNNLWKTDIASSTPLRNALKAMFITDGLYFSGLSSAIASGDIEVAAEVLTITLRQDASFYIPTDENITVTVPNSLLQYDETVASTVGFTVTNVDPTISIIAETISETAIRAADQTFDITVSGDEWPSSISSTIKSGIYGGANWDVDIKDNLTISRSSDQVIEVTIPGTPTFNVDVDETIGVKIDLDDLAFSTGDSISAAQTKTISAASITLGASASFDSEDEEWLRSSGGEIEISLNEDTWVSEIGTDHAFNAALINGLSFSGQASATTMLRNAILGSDQGETYTSVVGNLVTFTVPAIAGFDITDDTELSISVPASAMTISSSDLSVSNFASVDSIGASVSISSTPVSPISETSLNGATLLVTLSEDKFVASPSSGNYSFLWSGTGSGLSAGSINRNSDTEIEITLSYSGDLDVDEFFRLLIDPADLLGSVALTSPAPGITVEGIVEPIITGVSIPNVGMGIGAVVTATITVEGDNGQTFDLEGGSIAGRALYGLSRDNETTYRATFNVGTEGSNPQYAANQNIPYTNIQMSNSGSMGLTYSGIVGGLADADVIDTQRPVVSLISYSGGTYKAGETVTAVVSAGEEDLDFSLTETMVNTYALSSTNISLEEVGSGIYYLHYEILANDPEVTGSIPTQVRVSDGVGNESALFSTVSGTDPVIDASTPTISSIDVISTGDVIPGENVVLSITASESGLVLASGSEVNGVPMSSGNLSSGASPYTLTYTVGANDAEVVSGALTATIILEDLGGNQVSSSTIESNTLAIYTEQPVSFIHGTTAVCAGESTTLYLSTAGGVSTYDVEISLSTGGVLDFDAIGAEYSFDVTPSVNTEYTILSVVDNKGVVGSGNGKASVTVNLIPTPIITSPDASTRTFPVGGSEIYLEGHLSGGVFSGPGVESSENYFHPGVAGVGAHTIVYTYTEPATGCVGSVNALFDVVEDQANLYINGSTDDNQIICFNEESVTIVGENLSAPDPGHFYCYYLEEGRFLDETEGFIDMDLADDEAYLNPKIMPVGRYRFYYEYYFEGYTWQLIWKEFTVKKVENIKFISVPAASVCSNDNIIPLEANLDDPNEDYEFHGSGVRGSIAEGFDFYPSNADVGGNYIVYDYESNDGCAVSDSVYTYVHDVPDVDFSIDRTCVFTDDREVTFTNETDKIGLVNSWKWNFGDTEGSFNTIEGPFQSSVSHDYSSDGAFNVLLSITTTLGGCIAEKEALIDLADSPIVDFRWKSDCWLDGIPVEFVNESEYGLNAAISNTWRFYDSEMNLLDTIYSLDNDVQYTFDAQEDYFIEFLTENTKNCTGTLIEKLVLKPTNTFGDDVIDFFTDFNDDDAKWSARMDNVNSEVNSWTYGEPDFEKFVPSTGDMAWYTDLNKELEERTERSWIQSPCFDFRNATRPMIRMDVMKSFDNNRDGAVLQYTLNNGVDWVTVGNISEGIEWYNSFEIKEKPGGGDPEDGSPIGWSGDPLFSPDTNWVTVAHDLDALVGEDLVIFGIFYATDGASVVDNEGFAVDNIYIGERVKRALIEHFTNAGDLASKSADDDVDSFVDSDSLDVTSIQYHMHYPGEDPMNENNPTPASARSFYYGINEIPFAMLDGGLKDNYKYDFAPSVPTEAHLKQLTLESPFFGMDVSCKTYGSSLNAAIEIEAERDVEEGEILLFVAIVEKRVTGYEGANGDREFRNVVLDMLPNAGGHSISSAWEKGDFYNREFRWEYINVEDEDELMLVAFLQDRESGKILQTATVDYSDFEVGFSVPEFESLNIYPNPVKEHLYISDIVIADHGLIEITDMTGRVLQELEVYSGDRSIEISTAGLATGNYIVKIIQDGRVSARSKFIKID